MVGLWIGRDVGLAVFSVNLQLPAQASHTGCGHWAILGSVTLFKGQVHTFHH